MPPKVSVLMPVRNAEHTLEQAAGSILRQTMPDFELVAVDDGSTDSTPDLLDRLAARDPRVRVLHRPHGGIIDALNAGLEICRAPLIARMDADDISHPRRLESQAGFMDAHPEISVCSPLVRMFPRSILRGGLIRYEQWLNSLVTPEQIARDIFVESPVPHPGAMMRTAELKEIGGYQERGWAEDYDLWLRYHAAGKLFARVNETLIFWRQSEGRLTFNDPRYSVENFLRAKAFYLARILIKQGRPVVLWGAGKTGRRLLKHLLRNSLEVSAVIDIDPDKIGHRLRGRPVVAPDFLEGKKESYVVTAVSSAGARDLIRKQLSALGFAEGTDYVCAA